MDKPNAIFTQGLVKNYGIVQALKGVDLEVQPGEIYGFLGPNGAGKTTTIRCFLDLIRPQAGTVRVLGIDPQADPVAVRTRVGYLPGELRLPENMTGEDALRFLINLRGRNSDWHFASELAQRLEVDLKRLIRNLSHGNKQKLGVVQALMHRPELLLLDEPTLGLDPLMQQEVLRMMREAQAEGATVFFSSHIISEVETLAEKVAIIREGVIVEVVEVATLQQRALRRAHIRFHKRVDSQAIEKLPEVRLLSKGDGNDLWIEVKGDMDRLLKTVTQYPVMDLETHRPSLEEIFMAYYKADREEA